MAETIGDRIRKRRRALGITVKTLASKSGLAPSTIYDIENGGSHSTTKLHKIANELRLNVHYLESGKGDPETGEGSEPPPDGWPFKFDRFKYDRLPVRDRQAIEALVLTYISHCEVAREKRATKRRVG